MASGLQQMIPLPPPPKSKLGVYRQLSTMAGVHVSPLALGAMSIGDQWEKFGFGSMTKEDSFKLLDAYVDLGGNFIDTANNYQSESSEMFIGEWAEARGIRDQLFIATKYTHNPKLWDPSVNQKVMWSGNSIKSMHLTIESSLKKLRTSYIDLFYVHYWDFTTSIPELMHALHALVTTRKVLYLGISDTPAWVVTKANQYARCNALTPFCIYQGMWNVMERSFERDIIPMARDEGMALAPWGVLAQGKIRSDAEEEKRRQTGEGGRSVYTGWERTESEKKICRALEEVAKEVGAQSIAAVAIAYVMHKTRYVFPVIGGRKVEHLVSNLEALEIALTSEHIKAIESVVPFDLGFPGAIFGDGTFYGSRILASGHREIWPIAQPIVGHK
ncbi:hypothetical protein EST38_g11993 [Candolleomyces aberdarensis]|uniref:NADP-dependent oxidoreductase domain-containing protein n=1 Tax=Candolleomyces aberdarensis TaxID=2316362 RepID=A0A4Q2D5S9_9AGAR|nr:hypothetical protein EST38_g11993 [Candolleomyces aberdarensis]